MYAQNCITLVSVSPRINLYLYSGKYDEDTISDHRSILVVTCFMCGVVSVTDEELEVNTAL